MRRGWLICVAAFAAALPAQELPDDMGRAETVKLCKQCHDLAKSVSLRQDKAGWHSTMSKMVAYGMKSSEKEIALVADYLAKHFPADEVPPLNVNTASAIEFESRLSMRRSQAAAVIAYREKNGPFKSLEDLKKVPGIDAAKLEEKKNRIVF